MYKVFVNEKRLTLSNMPTEGEKSIHFEGTVSIEVALDLLENTSRSSLTLYHKDIDVLWEAFCSQFKLVEAAGGLVQNAQGDILFIYRLQRWDLPKGKIEKGESLSQAALREVEEETSLEPLELGESLGSTYHTYSERDSTRVLKTTHWYRMKYYGEKVPVPQLEEGITAVEWKNEDAIKNQVLSSTFRNIALILETSERECP